MKTITLTSEQAQALEGLLRKLIPANRMLDMREVTPNYNEVMAMIEIANQLKKITPLATRKE